MHICLAALSQIKKDKFPMHGFVTPLSFLTRTASKIMKTPLMRGLSSLADLGGYSVPTGLQLPHQAGDLIENAHVVLAIGLYQAPHHVVVQAVVVGRQLATG